MEYISYQRAETVADAVCKLTDAGENAIVLAGGTDLLVGFNRESPTPDKTIVYIGDIESLKLIEETEAGLRIGAMATTAEIAASPLVGRYAQALQQAARESAGPQVRNRATIGGNVATASPSGDMIPALMALDVSVFVAGGDGMATLDIRDLLIGVKKTCLARNQVITQFVIPKAAPRTSSAFEKIGKRKAMTISAANAACCITLDPTLTRFEKVQVAVGAVAPTVRRASALEAALCGQPVDPELIREKARLVDEVVSPITDQRTTQWYRREVIPVLVSNAIRKAVSQIQNESGVAR